MSAGANASSWQVYRRLLRFALPYRNLLWLAVIGMLIEAAAGAGFTKLMEPVINQTFIARNTQVAIWLPLAIVGLFVLRGAAGYLTDYYMAKSGRGVARDLRVQVLGKYLRLPGARFDTEPVPSMLVRHSASTSTPLPPAAPVTTSGPTSGTMPMPTIVIMRTRRRPILSPIRPKMMPPMASPWPR